MAHRDFVICPHNVGCIERLSLNIAHQNGLQQFGVEAFESVTDEVTAALSDYVLDASHGVVHETAVNFLHHHCLVVQISFFHFEQIQ